MKKTTVSPGINPAEVQTLLVDEYAIKDAGGLSILKAGICAYSRAEAARKRIDKDGLMIPGKDNTMIKHPLLSVERDSRAQWLAALRQLNLDVEPQQPRPGRPNGR